MSTTKHTPGPWNFEPVKVMVGYSQGIGFINLSVKQMTIEQAWDDKKLMDAAPELLAVVKGLVIMCGYVRRHFGDHLEDIPSYAKAMELIRKLEG